MVQERIDLRSLPSAGKRTEQHPEKSPQPLYLCGPTASGKSSIALSLAHALNGEIVNGDSLQLYRGIETITASPSKKDRDLIPHHLYGIADPCDTLNAGQYREMALPVLEDIRRRGKLAIVVGGSGLYLKFLTHGPDDLPPTAATLRAELETLSLHELNSRLRKVDPDAAASIDRDNARYVQRALEISLTSGQPASQLRSSFRVPNGSLRGLLLSWAPSELDLRIRKRTAEMLEGNAERELASLSSLGSAISRAIGVPQIRRLIDGAIDRDACLEEIVLATRQYAKRQRTWFRREQWLTSIPGSCQSAEIIATAQRILSDGRAETSSIS